MVGFFLVPNNQAGQFSGQTKTGFGRGCGNPEIPMILIKVDSTSSTLPETNKVPLKIECLEDERFSFWVLSASFQGQNLLLVSRARVFWPPSCFSSFWACFAPALEENMSKELHDLVSWKTWGGVPPIFFCRNEFRTWIFQSFLQLHILRSCYLSKDLFQDTLKVQLSSPFSPFRQGVKTLSKVNFSSFSPSLKPPPKKNKSTTRYPPWNEQQKPVKVGVGTTSHSFFGLRPMLFFRGKPCC